MARFEPTPGVVRIPKANGSAEKTTWSFSLLRVKYDISAYVVNPVRRAIVNESNIGHSGASSVPRHIHDPRAKLALIHSSAVLCTGRISH